MWGDFGPVAVSDIVIPFSADDGFLVRPSWIAAASLFETGRKPGADLTGAVSYDGITALADVP